MNESEEYEFIQDLVIDAEVELQITMGSNSS